MSNNIKEGSLITYNYDVPTDKSPFTDSVLDKKSIAQLQLFNERLKTAEENFLLEKDNVLQEIKIKKNQEIEKLLENFSKIISDEVNNMQKSVDTYFSQANKHCLEICSSALKQLYIDISDDDKISDILEKAIKEYNSENQAILRVSTRQMDFVKNMQLPEGWKLIECANIDTNGFVLQFEFGDIVGNFDKSFTTLLSFLE